MRDAIPARGLSAALLFAALLTALTLGRGVSEAQAPSGDAEATQNADDSVEADPGAEAEQSTVHVDARTGHRYREVRPPEGLRRGRFSSPSWVVGGLGVLTAAGAIAALVWRSRRSK